MLITDPLTTSNQEMLAHLKMCTSIKREKLHKVVVIEFCSIVQIQQLKDISYSEKDEKGKLHKVVVVEPAGGKNRRQKFVRAIKGRCSIKYYIFSALILHNCILYTDLVNCQIHIVKLYCAIVSCIRCMKT